MPRRLKQFTPLVVLVVLMAGCHPDAGSESAPLTVRSDLPASLAARAAIPVDEARSTARAAVPNGRLVSEELEEEDGRLIYSFDLVTAGSPGIDEVGVDATSGLVLDVQHEDAAAERAEAALDAAQPSSAPGGEPR